MAMSAGGISIKFQSHIGAIRIALQALKALKALPNFNPTLVQLELVADIMQSFGIMHFNPTLVQLESMGGRGRRKTLTNISIPHWCN